jgi:hypothetical protein
MAPFQQYEKKHVCNARPFPSHGLVKNPGKRRTHFGERVMKLRQKGVEATRKRFCGIVAERNKVKGKPSKATFVCW